MEGKSYDRLKYLGLCTLQKRRNRQDLTKLFKVFKGLSHVRIDELFMLDENTKGTKDHCLNLRKTLCTKNFIRIGWSKDGICLISG